MVVLNSSIYTDRVMVNTACVSRRSRHDIRIGTNDHWKQAREWIVEACSQVEGVLTDPAPETISIELANFSNIIRLRW